MLLLEISKKNDEGQLRSALDAVVRDVQRYLGAIKIRADEFNIALRDFAFEQIEARRNRILAQRKMLLETGYPLQSQEANGASSSVPKRSDSLKIEPPLAESLAEDGGSVLKNSSYHKILNHLSNMAHVLERDPRAFASLGENICARNF